MPVFPAAPLFGISLSFRCVVAILTLCLRIELEPSGSAFDQMILPHIVWTVINRGIELASCLKKRTAQQPSRSGEGQVHLSFGGSDESEKEREKERERKREREAKPT
jgi:hypothetical protein